MPEEIQNTLSQTIETFAVEGMLELFGQFIIRGSSQCRRGLLSGNQAQDIQNSYPQNTGTLTQHGASRSYKIPVQHI